MKGFHQNAVLKADTFLLHVRKINCTKACVNIFQPGNFTGCGSADLESGQVFVQADIIIIMRVPYAAWAEKLKNLKQNAAQSARAESTRKGVN